MDRIKILLGENAYNTLFNGGFSSLQHIILADFKTLEDLTGASKDIVKKIIYIASEEVLKGKYSTANQIEPWGRISVGCKNLDQILNGGIPINGICELYGCSGVGKTQFCLQLALQIQLFHDTGKKRQDTIYICTEDVFPSRRLKQLACAFRSKYKVDTCFEDHIFIQHIPNFAQLHKSFLKVLPHFLIGRHVGLIIIDSIAGLFRSENENPDYISRSQEFAVIAKFLLGLQDQYSIGILMVNQVVDNLTSGLTEPCLGLSWANNVTCRFRLSRNGSDLQRRFEVIFAPDLRGRSSNLLITPDGILDT